MSKNRSSTCICSVGEFIAVRNQRYAFQNYTQERLSLWNKFDGAELFNLPNRPCCYVIYIGGKVAYVGSTENLKARMAKHFFVNRGWPTHDFILKAKFPRRLGEWAMTEIRLIRRLKPELNKRGKKVREVFCF